MWIVDTNHYSEIARESAIGIRLWQRMQTVADDVFISVMTATEVTRGWLATIQPHRQPDRGVSAYCQFQDSLSDLARWDVLPWSADAADIFDDLRKRKITIGTLDLRIACIALEYDATVLTRNIRDFGRVPGLRVENWLD